MAVHPTWFHIGSSHHNTGLQTKRPKKVLVNYIAYSATRTTSHISGSTLIYTVSNGYTLTETDKKDQLTINN